MTSFIRHSIFFLGLLLLCAVPGYGQVILWDSTGVPVCTAAGWQRNPRMVTDGAKGAIIVWEDLRSGSDAAIYAARIREDGTMVTTTDGRELVPPQSGQRLAGIVSDGMGGAYVGWWNRVGNDGDVFVQRIDHTCMQIWPGGDVAVCAAVGRQEWAEMTSDGQNGVILTWHDKRTGSDNDIYAQRVDPFGAVLWTADGVAVSTAPGDQNYPQLATDQAGGAYVAWMDRRTEDDIYAQHVLADGTLDWKEDLPVCVESNRQVAPKVIPYGEKSVAFFWQDYRLGPSTSALYLQVIDENGDRLYPEDYQVSQSDNAQSGMALTDDGQKGALAVWTDYRSGAGEGDVYMRRIRADGMIVGDFGNALCDYANTQERPAMISDGHGGGFAVWQDKRNTFDYDLYMNRISSQGQTNYPEWNGHSGVLLARHDNNQLAPQVIASGVGHALICWYDGRTLDGQADIYAQRVAWAPSLSFPDSVDFGILKVGKTAYDTIRVFNDGARPLTITNIRRASNPGTTHPQDFIFYPTFALPATLQPGEGVDIALSFTPGGTGDRISELRVTSDAPQDPVIIPLHGLGTNPELRLKSVHQFRVTKVGAVNEETVEGMIQNTGTGMLVVPGIEIDGTDRERFSLGANPPFPLLIPEGESYALKLRFAPLGTGPKEATIRVFSNAEDMPKEARLSGIGAEPSLITIPVGAHFDTTMTTRNRETELRIRNTSGVELVVTDIQLSGGDADQFEIDATLPMRIPGEGSEPFLVRFTPSTVGIKRADILIFSDAPTSPNSTRVDGTAILLGVGDPSVGGDFRIEALYPQPVVQDQPLLLRLACASPSPVQIRLYDVLGRMRGELFDGRLPFSTSTLQFPTASLGLDPGIYMLRVESGPRRVTRMVVVSR
ncbi:MAG: choice-of-anchor D domain-containing protein [Bacteroidetes bacterium]|nr:choice-of-anchor D domain-containing protein [Bacteroidota bacterium]